MVQKNLDYIIERVLPNLGFGEVPIENALSARMALDLPSFAIHLSKKDNSNNEMKYELKFDKSGEMYYLNAINAELKKPNAEPIKNEFRLYNQRGFNADQMKNLLEGRSVYRYFINKEKQRVGVWSHLDFNTTNENGNPLLRQSYENSMNFNLASALSALPNFNATQQEKEILMKSLQDGDLTSISLKRGGVREIIYLEAAPHKNMLVAYNSNMEKIELTRSTMHVVQNEKVIPETTKRMIEKAEQGQEASIKKKVG